ncbi:hypothetical protein FQP34_27320 [Peribacillus simplex]|uniref:Uncharacterized protein n=2 Tax=Peribacillus TaxID=2675229 RepID=A0A8B5XTD5_9BACI|nr:hypothetical protein [Peribacillus simplex]MED3912877.1 hypothetical protein [Peribacillus simplex]TVX75688.1 hypothetical protein FQP34_27320 [Peribacillus simplex]
MKKRVINRDNFIKLTCAIVQDVGLPPPLSNELRMEIEMKKNMFSFTSAIVGVMAPLLLFAAIEIIKFSDILLISSLSLYGVSIVCTIIAVKRKEKNKIKYIPLISLIPFTLYQLLILLVYSLGKFING